MSGTIEQLLEAIDPQDIEIGGDVETVGRPIRPELKAEARERRRREVAEREEATIRARQQRLAGLREANEARRIGATNGQHRDLEEACMVARAKALGARQAASSRAFQFPQHWNERVEQMFLACEAAREVSIDACEDYLTHAEALLVAAEAERREALTRACADLARQKREAEDVATRLEEALTAGSAEVLGSLQQQIRVFPHVLTSAELRVAEAELALARCQVPATEAKHWITDEQRKLAEERQRYEESRSYRNGDEARAASQAWSALSTKIHGLEAKVVEARRELQDVSAGARQRATRVGKMAARRR